jgi:hypothetical protein
VPLLDVDGNTTTSLPSATTDTHHGVDKSKHVELLGLMTWMVSLSTFVFVNDFVRPWSDTFKHINERFFMGHMVGGMLFGGE